MKPFVAAAVRFIGAFQAGVGAYLLTPEAGAPARTAHVLGVHLTAAPGGFLYVALGVGAAVLTFVLTAEVELAPGLRDIALKGYVLPLGAVLGANVACAAPNSWAGVEVLVPAVLREVFARTPLWAYCMALSFGAYRAHEAGSGNPDARIYR